MEAVTAEISQDLLVQGLKAGDESSVTAFVEALWAPAYRIALRHCGGDSAAAEDVAQKALLNALRGIHSLRPGRALRPWFFRIVGNAAREQLRGARRRARHERRAPAPTPGTETTEAAMSKQEELDTVRRHVDQLPEHYRAAISLRFLEGLSLREVAESLGCREGTVSSRIRRGLAALRRSLGPALATSVLLLLPQVAQAEEVPPPPPAAELLVARGPLLPAQPASRLPAYVAGVAFLALLAGGLVNALAPNADRPQLAETLSAQPSPPGAGGATVDVKSERGGQPDRSRAKPDLEPSVGARDVGPLQPLGFEPTPLASDPAPIDSTGITGPQVPTIHGSVVSAPTVEGVLTLSVGSDDLVKRGYRFIVYKNAQEIAVIVVNRVRRDSCDCGIYSLVRGETIKLGDRASTRLE